MNHANEIRALGRLGLVSAYHVSRGVEARNEPDPTFYWRRRAVDGYHIDYVFMPEEWSTCAFDLTVGPFEKWIGPGLSDHVPLVLEITPPQCATQSCREIASDVVAPASTRKGADSDSTPLLSCPGADASKQS